MIGNDGQHRYKNKHNTCRRKEQCIISIAKNFNLLKRFDYNSHLIFFKTTMRCYE